MDSSGIDHNEVNLSNKAQGYIYKNGKLTRAPYDNMDRAMGNGNLFCTANDIYKYYLAIENRIFFSKETQQQFLTPPKGNKIKGYTPATGYYAKGIIADTLDRHPYFTHGGGVYGFTSDITLFLEDKTLIVVLFNNESSAYAWALSQGLRAVLFSSSVTYPYKYQENKIDNSTLQKYVGQYGHIKLYRKGHYLYLNDASGPEGDIKLISETETSFFFEDENDRRIEFILDNQNNVSSSWIIAGGIRHLMKQKQ